MQFFKKAGNAFHSRAGSFIFFALAAASFTFMCSSSWAYDWIAEIYPLGEKFVPTILSVIAACVVITFAYFILFSLKNTKSFSNKALFRISHTIFAVLTGILFVYTTVRLLQNLKMYTPIHNMCLNDNRNIQYIVDCRLSKIVL